MEFKNASDDRDINKEDKDDEEIDESQKLNYDSIKNSSKSFTSLLNSINYNKNNNFILLFYSSTEDSKDDNDLCKILILLINKGYRAIQEVKEGKLLDDNAYS